MAVLLSASRVLALLLFPCLLAATASAATFTDSFDAGASSQWQNEVGSWVASGGAYSATSPGNAPNAHSSLPFSLTDFTVDVDVLNAGDGGIWLRGSNVAGAIGVNGVLLVNNAGTLYWHIVTDGNSYGASLNGTGVLYAPGSTIQLTVVVSGDNYEALLNSVSATTLNTSAFASGFTALYDNSAQSFDNFSVTGAGVVAIPEPSTYALMLAGLGLVGWMSRRRALRP